MTKGRLIGYTAGAMLVSALVGFFFGLYQAYPAEHAHERAMLRLRLSEARARALDGRLAIYRTNWGDASAHLQEAVRLLDAFKATGQEALAPDDSAKVDQAAQQLREARNFAVQSNQDANARAERAATLLHEVYRATPEP